MEPQSIELASQAVEEFLEHMDMKGEVATTLRFDDSRELLIINITVKTPSLLIGQQGANLQAFQHIARLLVRKKCNEQVNFIVDVNEYKTKRIEYLKSLAVDTAKRVIDSGKFEVLRPMSSYERRIIHMELAQLDKISAESLGEEPNRRIVVRPVGEKGSEDVMKEIEAMEQHEQREQPE